MTGKDSIALESRSVEDGRLHSPSAGRNKAFIAEMLARILPDGASVLEVASGTGEHGFASVQARPDFDWQPSDPDPDSRISIDAWAKETGGQMRPSLDIDVMQAGWTSGLDLVDAVFCANMIHIAPWAAAEGLVRGAAQLVREDGYLILYGPFLLGEQSAPSNLEFDVSLKSRNPDWGVRALDEVARFFAAEGFQMTDQIDMPANNLIVVFEKRSAS